MSDAGPSATAGLPDAIAQVVAKLDEMLAPHDRALQRSYPGEPASRQPVHTVYVPADRFRPDLAAEWGRAARQALADNAPSPAEFGAAMGLPDDIAAAVRERVVTKLSSEPVEDLRLDFEDGYQPPAVSTTAGDDAAEDADARTAARNLAAAAAAGSAPPFTGIRCKSLEAATRLRAIRTVSIFLAELLAHGPMPAGFALTVPKVTSADQVRAMVLLCESLEQALALPRGDLVFEIQAETPQLILGADGSATIARCIHAGGERLAGIHYGTYDYAAALGIAGQFQRLDHPAADHARQVMQVAAAGTGVRLSDGSYNVRPAGSRADVIAAWRQHSHLVRRSLERGFYQGWDLHPGQLVSRYAATYGFFVAGADGACDRLRSYTGSIGGTTLEEPATARALAWFLLRGIDCGALSEAGIVDRCGLDRTGLRELRRARRRP
ncbi:MAG TPA: aldolase [Streptosporangiaceae bacterium]|nr:aldolase [Streptosporangiaceae bacterium]